MKRCTRCVLTENHPDIAFNDQGVCNYCLEFDATPEYQQMNQGGEDEFVRLLQEHRGRGEYDCLVMLSGGKDSTYALYLLKKRYGLNVLGFTFDNHFESEAALANVRQAVDALEVDYLYLRPVHLKQLFRFLLQNRMDPSTLCIFCKRAMGHAAWEAANKFGAGLIVSGDTKGQRYPMRRPMAPGADLYYQEAAALIQTQAEFEPLLPIYLDNRLYDSPQMAQDGIRFVSPYHYMAWDAQQIMDVLKREIDWQAPSRDYPRTGTNCRMSLVNAYISRQKYGFSWYDTEMSTLIRYGEITRQDALQRLEVEIEREIVDTALARLDLTLDDLKT